MKTDEINIAIAEFCLLRPFLSCGVPMFCDPKNHFNLTEIPNYYGDLNACRDALMHLIESQPSEYQKSDIAFRVEFELPKIMAQEKPRLPSICATAPQVCEALLRTIGKWRAANE